MLELKEDLLIGTGTNRKCYQHPTNPDLCIKVLLPDTPKKVQSRETKYFQHLEKSGVHWDYIVPLIKMEKTSSGAGAIFDLVRDYDGQVSKSIDFYFKQNTPHINHYIVSAIELMKQDLLTQNIMFRDLITLNILLQKTAENEFHLKIIDGIGHNDFIPLCHIPYFGNKKIKRMWNRKLNHWFGHYENIAHLIKPYS